jgi:hypothetical protein
MLAGKKKLKMKNLLIQEEVAPPPPMEVVSAKEDDFESPSTSKKDMLWIEEIPARKRRMRRSFTPEEDEQLRMLVQEQRIKNLVFLRPPINWELIASQMPSDRTAKQCRSRWFVFLMPGINHEKFSLEEDDLLIQLVEKYGKKWSFLAENFFPGRTDMQLRGRWYSRSCKRRGSKSSMPRKTPEIEIFKEVPIPMIGRSLEELLVSNDPGPIPSKKIELPIHGSNPNFQ